MLLEPRTESRLPGVVWPAFPNQRGVRKEALLFQLEQTQWLPAKEIERAQLVQLRSLLSHAVRNVGYYRSRVGPAAADITDLAAWRELPILDRQTLNAAGNQLVADQFPREHGKAFELKTSGSTGLVVRVRGTELTQLLWEAFCLRDHSWHRREFSRKLIVMRYQRDAELKIPEGVPSLGWGPATDDIVRTGPSRQYHLGLDIAALADALAREQPGYLLTHPSVVRGLARHCLDAGISVPGMLEVRTLGESSSPDLADLCRKAWGVSLVDMYTCQEAGYLALQCPDHSHLHVQSENVFLEVVDNAGRPCGPGQVGRVLITSLANFATPLIRYELGDCAEVGDACPCGRGLPVIRRVMGRYRNLLTMPDGALRWPVLGNEGRLRDIAPIGYMQLVQTGIETIAVRLVMARKLVESEQQDLTTYIQGNLGHPFRLQFEYVDSIRNPVNGKVEQFISRLEPTPR